MLPEFFQHRREICKALQIETSAAEAAHNNHVRRGRGEYDSLQLALVQILTDEQERFFDMLITEGKVKAAQAFLRLKKDACKQLPLSN